MDKLFILKFAFRNLLQHRLRAILTLAGVVIGVSTIVFLVSFALGIQRLVTDQVSQGDAFLLIDVGTGNSQVVGLTDATVASIKGVKNVNGVYGTATVGATAKIGDKSMDASFVGTSNTFLEKSAIRASQGTGLTGAKGELLVNSAYVKFWSANNKGSVIGQNVNFDLVIPKELNGGSENKAVPGQTFKVVGVVKDDTTPKVYANFANLHDVGVTGYTQLKVEAANKGAVPALRTQIENMGLKTQYVGDTVDQINQVFSIFQAILASFGLITLAVALLGMFNTLTISLLERIKEIALMKMLGMRKADIRDVFLTESMLMGVTGGLFGLAVGVAAGYVVNYVLNLYAQRLGGAGVSVFYSPLLLIVLVAGVSVLTGFLAGLYPAYRATRVKSIDVLRYE